jgi:hypothetical protein
MKANDAVHKERQLRKRDSKMIRLMYENPSPTNRPPMPHAPFDEEDSEPKTFESIWERSQQVDPATNKDYWDRACRNTYYNPTFGGMYNARSSYSEVPLMDTQGQGTSSSMPQVDPNAQKSSSTVGGYYYGSLFGSVNPYEGMASHLPPFPPQPSSVPPGPLLVINDKGGKMCRFKAQPSVFCLALSVKTRWNRFPDLSGTGFSVFVSQLSWSGKLGGTEFPKLVAPVLAVRCNRPM